MNRVTIKQAAYLTGMSALTIRKGIEYQELDIGSAIHTSAARTTYHVVPDKLANYLGISLEEMLEKLRQI